ncbi:SWI/SNF complex protein [Tothia fuscella]|uniref:SWI/SNF complex protein n=1 Tax=Tothia fuscella TaxID=1048955 RepID=A0A9P4TXY5_9PEZI|nr:SWI/SNF complex protein [Tothia fuscella]
MDEDVEDSKPSGDTSVPDISDNPLDAPHAPVHETDDADAAGDAEMGGTDDKKDESAVDTYVDPATAKSNIESAARSHLVAQTHQIVLPSYSAWFDMNSIHNIERKGLPEWFNSRNRSKTPATYKDTRDFMVNTYRLNPTEYLTFTACRRNLCGDVCAIMRVHNFLEAWGLINYQVDPDTRPSNIGPPFTGHFRITADTPRGLQPHQPAPGSTVTSGKAFAQTERLANAATPSKSDLNYDIRRNVYEANGKAAAGDDKKEAANGESSAANGTSGEETTAKLEDSLKEPVKRYFCHTCGIDCTKTRYHYAKTEVPGQSTDAAKYDICPSCMTDNHKPNNTHSSDYVRLDSDSMSTLQDRDKPWSETEELLLLEGLEMYDDDWNKISDWVGSRTREECVLKFLQLEIEDKYAEPEPGMDVASVGASALQYLGAGRVPFSQADNPVLSVMSYLVGLADPKVTAAAAGKAVEEVKKTMRARIERGSSSDKGKEKEGVEAESAMEVDAASPGATDDNAVVTSTTSSRPNSLTTVPFALSAARSAALSSHQERSLTRLIHTVTNLQMNKLELKQQQFAELEALLSAERRDLERRRQTLFLDRLGFQKRCRSVQEAFARAAQLPTAEGMRLVQETIKASMENEALGLKKSDAVNGGEVQPPAEDMVKAFEL